MFASNQKATTIVRVVWTTVILFNALFPTAAAAKPWEDTTIVEHPTNSSSVAPSSESLSREIPVFARPTPRKAEHSGEGPDSLSSLQPDHQPAILFVENVGQFERDARFQTQGEQGAMYLTNQGLWISLQERKLSNPAMSSPSVAPTAIPGAVQATLTPAPDSATDVVKGVNLRMTFVGANYKARMEGFDQVDTTVSYFQGNDAKKWRADVPVWSGVRYVDFYPGFDLEVSSDAGALSWQLVPNKTAATQEKAFDATPADVRLRIEGAEQLTLAGSAVQVKTGLGDMLLPLPVTKNDASLRSATQSEGDALDAGSTFLDGNEIVIPLFLSSDSSQDTPTAVPETPASQLDKNNHFAVFKQDGVATPNHSLLLSGTQDLLYSTYLGSGEGMDIVVDQSGAAYVVGTAWSTSFPTTPGAYQTALTGGYDVFVAKLSPDGSQLLYSTFVGGSAMDNGNGIAVDASGNVYITGRTLSSNYPTTAGAFDRTNPNSEAFITKLNATGTSLVYSTYLGTGGTQGFRIAVNNTGEAYVVGQTTSSTFPTTSGAFDTTRGGTFDGFVTRLNASGTGLVFSTFIGGSYNDCEEATDLQECDIALGTDGSVYIAGLTGSSDFPTTDGAYDRSYNGSFDLFVLQLNPSGSGLVYSTYLGSTGAETCKLTCSLAVDSDGYAYVTGPTTSTTFPTTAGAYDRTHNGGRDAFLTKLQVDGSDLVYSTYLGSSGDDEAKSIAVTSGMGPVLTGWASTSFPTSYDAIQSDCYEQDAFVARFSINGDALNYSTCLGGTGLDMGSGIAATSQGSVYITGLTFSSSFPTTPGAYNSVMGSGVFVSKLVGFRTVVYTPSTYDKCPEDCQPTGGTFSIVGGPINTQTGGQYYQVEDISIPTSAGPLAFRRNYSSLAIDFMTDTLGYGWSHNHDVRLILPGDPDGEEGYVLFKGRSTNRYQFIDNGDDTYSAAPGVVGELTYDASEYILTLSDRSTYTFDDTGLLESWGDSNGHTWEYTYTDGLLEQIDADGGTRFLDLEYDSQGRIESVSDHTERMVEFHYDPNGDLDAVTDVLDRDWEYDYNAHRLTEVFDPLGNTIERTEYDPEGRAVQQWDGLDHLVVEITYNSDGTRTVKDANENVITYTYDSRKTLIGTTDALGATAGKTYDPNFRPSTITDALDNPPTLLDWSEDGANLEYSKDASGAQTFIYYEDLDAPNSPTEVKDPLLNRTLYFYDNTDFPTLPTRIEYPLSFDGGVTYIGTDYEYYPPSSGGSAGKVKFVTDALGNQTYYTYTPIGQTESVTSGYGTDGALTTDYEYDTLGRLTKTTDPSGIVTINEYDAAGQLLKTTHNFVDTRPRNDEDKYNIVTEYRYDERNNQIAVIDTYRTITRTYYDAANRPVVAIQNLVIGGAPATSDADVTAAANTPLANVPGFDSTHPDWNIRNDTEYDDAGNVIVMRDPAGIITRTYYDAANRPKLVIQNWSGTDLYGSILDAPPYDPAFPDQNVRTENFYDDNNNLIAIKDTLGIITRTYYDELNRPESVVQHLTGQEITDPGVPARGTTSNIRTDTHYDANGNVIATVDPNNVTTRTYYDSLNRPIAVVQNLTGKSYTDPTLPDPGQGGCGTEANICSFTYYDPAGNVMATVDPRGIVTRTYYDESNRPYATVQNLAGQSIDVNVPPERGDGLSDTNVRTDISYDPYGRRDTTTDPRNRVTKYAYNELGQLVKTTANFTNGGIPQNEGNQRNIVTAYEYDALGRQVKVTDTLDRVTLSDYDALGRLLKTTQNELVGEDQNYKDEDGNQYNLITSFSYDIHGNQIALTDTQGVVTRTYHDMLGRPVTVVQNLVGHDISLQYPPERDDPPSATANIRTDTIYLGTGIVDYTLDAMGQTTNYSYDDLGRLSAVSDPLSHITTFAYDANGNRTRVTDAESIITRYEFDNLNRLKAVIENDSATEPADHETKVRTAYTYDAGGNRLSILDGKNHSTFFTYTAFGLLETETDALSHSSIYDYDAMGNRRSLLDANGNTTSFDYDELGRLSLVDYPDPDEDVTFTYDALGRRLSMTDETGTTSWSYTNIDLPNLITDPFGTGISYEYDPAGNRTLLSYNDQVVNYDYNNLNQLSEVSGTGLPDSVQYEYYASGQVKTITRPNGLNTIYNYFENGWLQDITHSLDSNPLASYQYLYDSVGNRVQAIEDVSLPATLPPTETPTPTPTYTPTATPSGTPAPSVVQDDFDGSLLGADWEWYVPAGGPTYSLSAEPDSLQLDIPPDKDHWVDTDNAPQVRRRDMGSGDWAIETYLALDDTNAGDNWQVNLVAGFDRYDQQWLSINNYNQLTVMRVGDGESAVEYEIGLPLYLRIEKIGTQYTFRYKEIAEDPWTTLDTQAIPDNIAYVGLQMRTFYTSVGDLVLNVDYFRLERSSQPDPGPEKEIEQDDFDQPTLNPDWTWYDAEKEGPTYSLTDVSGVFRMTLPQQDSFEHWIDVDDAPQLQRSDLGTGDWAIEAQLENISTAADAAYWAALHVGFDQYDQIWYGKDDSGGLKSLRISEYEYFAIEGLDLPLILRLEKHGEEYTFKYKYDANEAWTVTAPYLSSGTPTYVGLITRAPYTGSGEDLQVDWSYFRIERWEAQQSFLTMEDSLNAKPLPEQNETPQPNQPLRTPTPTRVPTSTPTRTPTPTLTPSPSDLGLNAPLFNRSEAPNIIANFLPVSYKLPEPYQQSEEITITYDYDPLYRLKEANYSTGDYYHYNYDAVGNRVGQDTQIGSLPTTTTYLYDDANRVQSVNGVTYIFDANGNLLNDGVNEYTYDSANRLETYTSATTAVSYAYNGLNDRLQETVNENTTTFTMDLNTGLTQTLSDGTNNYIYGIHRMAQINAATEYFLGDALGSVRQLTDQNGEVTYARAYDPYGVTTSTVGTAQSAYGYTGEFTSNDLVYLRARMYTPDTGRFLTRDTWDGNANIPMSFNRWGYGYGNPVKYTDPTGYFPEWCRSAWTKWGYARCVLDHYKLEPAGSIFFDGDAVKLVRGSSGCWSGPVQYRAGGYLEGYSWFGTAVWGGKEVVYSFASMERSEFTYIGGGLSDSVIGGGYALYAGFAEGLRSDITLENHYMGKAFVETYGADIPVALDIISFGLGVTESTSVSDWRLKTQSAYVSVGGAMGVPVVDIGFGLVDYTSTQANGLYESAPGSMLVDMITGKYSPYPSNVNGTALYAMRAWVAARTAKFFYVYQEMKDEEIESRNGWGERSPRR